MRKIITVKLYVAKPLDLPTPNDAWVWEWRINDGPRAQVNWKIDNDTLRSIIGPDCRANAFK